MSNLEWLIALGAFSLVILYKSYLHWQLRDSPKNRLARPPQDELRFNYPPYRIPVSKPKNTKTKDRSLG